MYKGNTIKKVLNRYSYLGIFFALIEQIIVASSILIINKIAININDDGEFLIWIIGYILSLSFVYLPRTFMNYYFNKAKYLSFKNLINDFSYENYGEVFSAYDRKFLNENKAYFTHESFSIVDESINFLKDFVELFFNIFFSVLAIAFTISPIFIIAYLASIPISIMFIKLLNSRMAILSDDFQKSHNNLMQHQNYGMSSIILGNLYNFKIWYKNFNNKCKYASDSKAKLDLNFDVYAFVLLMISSIPVIFAIISTYFSSYNNLALKTLILATLPRQLSMLQYLSEFINIILSGKDKVRRMDNLIDKLHMENKATKGIIDFSKIKIYHDKKYISLSSVNDIGIITNGFAPGLFTLIGENASGKSSLLAQLKEKLKDKAYFFSSDSDLYFNFDKENVQASTGQRILSMFDEIISSKEFDNIEVLLLDEIKANLDKKNSKIIKERILEISKNKCVIEVIHKKWIKK